LKVGAGAEKNSFGSATLVKSRDPKPKKQIVANEKCVAAAIVWILLKATAHCRHLQALLRQDMLPWISATYPD
jgi:hypothetical protein